MDIRQYIGLLRRQLLVVVITTIIVGGAATFFSFRQTGLYQATATLIAVESDPAVRLFENPMEQDRSRYIQAQETVITSFTVAREASPLLPGSDPSKLVEHVSAAADTESGVVLVRARHPVPTEAQAIADAFATAYVEVAARSSALRATKLAEDLQVKLNGIKAQMEELGSRIDDSGMEAQPGGQGAGSPGTLEATRLALGAQYQKLLERQQELLIKQNLGQQGPRLISLAALPQRPLGVGKVKTSLLGAFAGLLIGVACAVLRDHLDDRLRGRAHVERDLEVPVLGELPRDKAAKEWAEDPTVVQRPDGELAEAARALRTTVHLNAAGVQLRKLVITSPSPGDGKSFVAVNLAMAYARAGYKTVLVSSDLRRPSLERILSVEQTASGLAALLASPSPGSRSVLGLDSGATASDGPVREDVVVPCVVPNLLFLPTGPIPPNPAELLAGEAMADLLDALGSSSDMVILDSPSILGVTDALILGSLADGVLVVAADGQTAMPALRRSLAALSTPRVRIVGVVVNKVRKGRSREARYYRSRPVQEIGNGRTSAVSHRRGSQEAPAGPEAVSDAAPVPADEASTPEVPSTVRQ